MFFVLRLNTKVYFDNTLVNRRSRQVVYRIHLGLRKFKKKQLQIEICFQNNAWLGPFCLITIPRDKHIRESSRADDIFWAVSKVKVAR